MKRLLKKHYNLIVKRGLIKDSTTLRDFDRKITEEYHEVYEAFTSLIGSDKPDQRCLHECTDLVMTVLNMFQFYGIDFEDELRKNIRIQEGRI